jgi:phage tail sheath protein FI
MAVAVSYPGVYIQELSSGVRTIVGVSTSIGMFLGRSKLGELRRPERCLNYPDFERKFSSEYAESDLARSVRLFFDNGGSECFVMRIADASAAAAAVTLKDEAGVDSLRLTARSAGLFGNDIRAVVSYNTAQPEQTFNLELFRWVKASNGQLQKSQVESYTGLSMDVSHPRYCEDVLLTNSKLVVATDLRKATALAGNGVSISGFAISSRTNGILQTQLGAILTATQNRFRISVGGRAPVQIDLAAVAAAIPATPAAIETALTNAINAQLPPGATVSVAFQDGPGSAAALDNTATRYLTIQGIGADVTIEPAASLDLATALMLGTAQGGIEISRSASRRPAPNGVVFKSNYGVAPNALTNFAETLQSAVTAVRVGGVVIPLAGAHALQTTAAVVTSQRMYQDASALTQNDGRNGVVEKFGRIAAAINDRRSADPNFQWTAELWGTRLALIAAGDIADLATTTLEAGTIPAVPPPPFTAVADVFEDTTLVPPQNLLRNARYYVLAAPMPAPAGAFYANAVSGNDGGPPTLKDYSDAYEIIDREVDLFNLLVLPRDAKHGNTTQRSLWGPASVFCERRRAFLIMDPPDDWPDHNAATSMSVGVHTLRVGLAKQYAGLYFPNVMVREGDKEIPVGPSGAIAGLMARIDATRGVWKAAAGTEADLRGIVGVQRKFSDGENGVLNPRAINTIRVFPNGIVAWGARTMDGDDAFGSEYKYSCVRRLANFMEESLYRGLKWAVFEPNDEPLWAQIRLNVGAFMHNLFRQGAFQGATPREAYEVRCDATTTTQNDINLGIVNIVLSFAPLKPSEFVVLYVKQIAGQLQT